MSDDRFAVTASQADPDTGRRLADLLDRSAIEECLLRYCRGIDRHDADLAKSAYHEDATDDHGPFIGTGHGLVEWANAYHTEVFTRHQHYITNSTIELEGDSAHVETYYIMTAIKRDSDELLAGGGRYLDRFERRSGRWAIAERVCTSEWWSERDLFRMLDAFGLPVSTDLHDPSYSRPLHSGRPARILIGPGSNGDQAVSAGAKRTA